MNSLTAAAFLKNKQGKTKEQDKILKETIIKCPKGNKEIRPEICLKCPYAKKPIFPVK